MKALRLLFLLLVLQGLGSLPLSAVLLSNQLAQLQIDGTNSVKTFRGLITPSNCQLMGFANTNEALTATAGEPLQIYTVGLGSLTNFQTGNALDALLTPSTLASTAPRIIVPILAGTEVKSSTTLQWQNDHWITTHWGQPKLIRKLEAARHSLTNAVLKPGTEPFVVELEAVDTWLLGYTRPNDEFVLLTTADLRIGGGHLAPLQPLTPDVILRLGLIAQRLNGLPN